MIFKKRTSMLFAMLLCLSLILAACGGEQPSGTSGEEPAGENSEPSGESQGNTEEEATEGETYNWRFVTEEVDGQLQYEYAEEFAKRLKEKSDGRINIEVYEFGGLGDEVNQVEQLQAGAVEFAIVSPGFTGTMVKEGQVFALHYLFPTDQELVREILDSSKALNEDLAAQYEQHNIKVLDYWTEGAMAWTADRALQTPADFKNFKMRTQTSPLIQKSYEAYGATPQAMSWSELYTSLDRGVVQGQENPIFFIEDASFHEVQSHLMISNHNNYVTMTTANPTFYNNLPDDIRQMVDETVEELKPWIFDLQNQMNSELLEKIKNDTDHPTEVIELTEDQVAAFKELAVPVREYYINNVSTVDGKILEQLQKDIQSVVENK